jgi:hypothetical protein
MLYVIPHDYFIDERLGRNAAFLVAALAADK